MRPSIGKTCTATGMIRLQERLPKSADVLQFVEYGVGAHSGNVALVAESDGKPDNPRTRWKRGFQDQSCSFTASNQSLGRGGLPSVGTGRNEHAGLGHAVFQTQSRCFGGINR